MEKIVKKFWQGKVTLWKSFWLIGIVFNELIVFLIFFFEFLIFGNENLVQNLKTFNLSLIINGLSFFSKMIFLLWNIFLTVGIWRAAEKYRGNIIFIILTFLFLFQKIFGLYLIIV